MINFDSNASYGISDFVAQGLKGYGLDFGNPSSIHRSGQRSRALVEEARERLAKLINCGNQSRIVFTSGATEANNTALRWFSDRGPIITSSIEHPSVLECARSMAKKAGTHILVPYHPGIGIKTPEILKSVQGKTALVSLMWVNNETGEILPIPQIVSELRLQNPNVYLHSDAVQAFGKLDINFDRSGLDLLTISGHKVGALSGVGALVVGRRVPYEPLLVGGVQELHHRAGTENVLGIVSLGLVAQELLESQQLRIAAMAECRPFLIDELRNRIPDCHLVTPLERSVPNTLAVRIPGILADDLVVALDRSDICISSGAACASGKPEPSHVFLAMGLSEQEARETIRISFRGDVTGKQISTFIGALESSVRWMRNGKLGAAHYM